MADRAQRNGSGTDRAGLRANAQGSVGAGRRIGAKRDGVGRRGVRIDSDRHCVVCGHGRERAEGNRVRRAGAGTGLPADRERIRARRLCLCTERDGVHPGCRAVRADRDGLRCARIGIDHQTERVDSGCRGLKTDGNCVPAGCLGEVAQRCSPGGGRLRAHPKCGCARLRSNGPLANGRGVVACCLRASSNGNRCAAGGAATAHRLCLSGERHGKQNAADTDQQGASCARNTTHWHRRRCHAIDAHRTNTCTVKTDAQAQPVALHSQHAMGSAQCRKNATTHGRMHAFRDGSWISRQTGPRGGRRHRIGLMHGDYPQKVRQQTEWPCREDKSPPSPGVNRGFDPQLKDLASPGLQRPVRSDAVLSYLARFIDGPWRSLPLRRHSYCRWEPAALAPGCRRGCTAAYQRAWLPRCCLAAAA